jgi:hypothetical protein
MWLRLAGESSSGDSLVTKVALGFPTRSLPRADILVVSVIVD